MCGRVQLFEQEVYPKLDCKCVQEPIFILLREVQWARYKLVPRYLYGTYGTFSDISLVCARI